MEVACRQAANEPTFDLSSAATSFEAEPPTLGIGAAGAGADFLSTVTFQVGTPSGTTGIFAYQELLGLPAPRIDGPVVIPLPASFWTCTVAIGMLGGWRRHARRTSFAHRRV